MPSPKEPKTREELARSYFNMYKAQRQNQEKLASGEIDHEDLWQMAFALADRKIEERLNALDQKRDNKEELAIEIQQFREEQELKYRELYEWIGANDETTLKNLLDNECNTYEVKRQLQDHALSLDARDKLYERHTKLIMAHKDLLSAAGIDRVSREKKQVSAQPIEDWYRVKRAAYEKMQQLKSEFKDAAEKAKNEPELRDLIKYHFGFDFDGVVDVILGQHRRVLGLPMEIEQHE